MMSFMKNGDIENSKVDQQTPQVDSTSSDTNQSVSQPDYLKPAEYGKSMSKSTIFVTVLFAIGALGLWVMIKKVGPSAASAAPVPGEAKIDTAIAEFSGVKKQMYGKVDDIIGKLSHLSSDEEGKDKDLKKNPFTHSVSLGDFDNILGGNHVDINPDSVKDVKLWSIMHAEKDSCCIINNKILYVGDSIKDFEITKISPRSVELVSSSGRLVLKMSR